MFGSECELFGSDFVVEGFFKVVEDESFVDFGQ